MAQGVLPFKDVESNEEWKPIYRHFGNGIKIKTNQQWAEVPYVGSLKSPDFFLIFRSDLAGKGEYL
ncbi:MAG: hypothetical protein GTO45_08585 [Candidatus Aminicenantes bacterium]|nr:hypothetical protein [Candidatus Aminicenantes bacterium]NIM78888.1 hypothetical protein [Candidatus Aminicenantes bacterium]NIN18144.1 hypothetical protein [Candidatus Aminicenantes bacterium]NIN42043.1 hypothetical protein [Candidatus Aminicenantes bacterium]NIN84799.1 hypothetical protein [Candidatus Aminicenantes bacterium]